MQYKKEDVTARAVQAVLARYKTLTADIGNFGMLSIFKYYMYTKVIIVWLFSMPTLIPTCTY